MATKQPSFYCLWQNETILENLFDHLAKDDVCNVRLANSACCNLVTKRLFLRTNLTFTANTFTKQSRVQALSRIGHHIEHLTFYFPHSDATFLPPLIHPETGREISFLYTPHTSMASVLARPKFGNTGLGEILTEQYPPLFHAASNVPSFINAMKHVPNVRHLTIKTPGQNANERYRRDIVDYALISLRISLERAPLTKLTKLSLSSVHPSAIIYLRHVPGFGCTPSAGRRWRQIRKLSMSVEAWDFYGPSPGLDHLKMMDDFIRTFADGLEKLTFTWLGRKGPCPVALAADPLFAPPRSTQKLFNEVTSPMSPLPPVPSRRPVVFSNLRYMSVRNATMNAPQVADLVSRNRHCVREFDFDNVVLINNGSWDEALAPLLDNSGRSAKSDHWSRHSTASVAEIGTIPLLPPVEIREDWDAESAAAAAASQELLDVDVHGGDAGDDGFADTFGYEEEGHEDEMPELDSDLEAARQASMNFSAIFKKRRITKRRRRRKESHDREARDEPQPAQRHRLQKSQDSLAQPAKAQKGQQSGQSLRRQYSALEPSTPPRAPPQPQHYRSRSQLFGEMDSIRSQASSQRLFGEVASIRSQASSQRLFGEVASIRSHASSQLLFGEVTPTPGLSHSPYDSPVEDGQSLYEDYFPPPTPATRTSSNYEQRSPPMTVSSPIMDTKPSMPVLLQPSVYDPAADMCGGISAVQRDIEAEEAQRMLAENSTLQSSALKKAKEAVLTKMSERFHSSSSKRPTGPKRENMLPAMNMSMRLREGLFNRRGHKDHHNNHDHALDHQSMDVPILFNPR